VSLGVLVDTLVWVLEGTYWCYQAERLYLTQLMEVVSDARVSWSIREHLVPSKRTYNSGMVSESSHDYLYSYT
jgi:hypothetical protein